MGAREAIRFGRTVYDLAPDPVLSRQLQDLIRPAPGKKKAPAGGPPARCTRCGTLGTVETLVRSHPVCMTVDTVNHMEMTHRTGGRQRFCTRVAPCTGGAGCRWTAVMRSVLAAPEDNPVWTHAVAYIARTLTDVTAQYRPNPGAGWGPVRRLFDATPAVDARVTLGLNRAVETFIGQLSALTQNVAADGKRPRRTIPAWRMRAAYRYTRGHAAVRHLIREWVCVAYADERRGHVLLSSRHVVPEALDGADDWFCHWLSDPAVSKECSARTSALATLFARVVVACPSSTRGATLTGTQLVNLSRFLVYHGDDAMVLGLCAHSDRVAGSLVDGVLRAWGDVCGGLHADRYMEALRDVSAMSWERTLLVLHWLRRTVGATGMQRFLAVQCARVMLHTHDEAAVRAGRYVLSAVCIVEDAHALGYVARTVAFPVRLLREAAFLTPAAACLVPISYFGCTGDGDGVRASYEGALRRVEDYAARSAFFEANPWLQARDVDDTQRRAAQCRVAYLVLQLRLVNCLVIIDTRSPDHGEERLRALWRTTLQRSRFADFFAAPGAIARCLSYGPQTMWGPAFAPESPEMRDVLRWHHALAVALLWTGSVTPAAGLDDVVEFVLDHLGTAWSAEHPIVWFGSLLRAGLRHSVGELMQPALVLRAWDTVDRLPPA